MSRRVHKPISKKRKFCRDGVFYAELNEFFQKQLAQAGYTGCNVRVTPQRTEIIIKTTAVDKVSGKEERNLRALTALVQKRFDFKPGSLICIAGTMKDQSLSALSQAEAVKYRLLEGLSVRRACYSVLKFIKERGAKGCEVIVSGKLRGQRAKSMKFREGYMIAAGDACNYYIDEAVKHVHLRQGVLGIKVKIMLPSASEVRAGGEGVEKELPDKIELPTLKELPADKMLREQIRRQALEQLTTQPDELEVGGVGDDLGPMDDAGAYDDGAAVDVGAAAGGYGAPAADYGMPAQDSGAYGAVDAGYAAQPPAGADYGAPVSGGYDQGGYGAPPSGGRFPPAQPRFDSGAGGPPPRDFQGGFDQY